MTGLQRITVLGTGVLGAQIAYQSAFCGKEVIAYDIDDAALQRSRQTFTWLTERYRKEVPGGAEGKADQAHGRLAFTTDLAEAAADADLIVEAIPEVLELKQEVFGTLAELAPAHTIFATNSSTLLPSEMAQATRRPGRFLALHFANQIWRANTAEVMGTAHTDPAVFDAVVGFAADIGMVPIPIYKEKAGHLLNSLLVPFITNALELLAGGYAEPKSVDQAWTIGTGARRGPFRLLDVIGTTTTYNILMAGTDSERQLAAWLKEHYIDTGRTGLAAGKGFYDYDENGRIVEP